MIAYTHFRQHATDLDEDIIPTTTMIKNIPRDWKTGHLLHLMSQMKLPSPTALNYLYDDFDVFRGMAFANFASPDKARRVIQVLNNHQLSVGTLKVQYKKKRPENIATEIVSRRTPYQRNERSHIDNRYKPYIRPQATVSPAPRPARHATQPFESYALLMGYQTEPLEKEKLREFFAQTGDYQEAVNEFAKNRARELQGDIGRSVTKWPILEMRAATPGELQEMAAMEIQFGLGCEVSSSGSPMIRHEGEDGVLNVTKNESPECINLAFLENKHETTPAEQGTELDEGKDEEGIEKDIVD